MRGVFLRSLEIKFSVMKAAPFALSLIARPGHVLLAGKHVQKVKNQFSFGPIVLRELQNYFLAGDLLPNTD